MSQGAGILVPALPSSFPQLVTPLQEPLLTSGSQFIFDACKVIGNPYAAGAALPANSVLPNLVGYNPSTQAARPGMLFGYTGLTNLAGLAGLQQPASQSGATTVSLQDYYDLSSGQTSDATDHEFLIIHWIKFSVSALPSGNVVLLGQNPAGGANSAFTLLMGSAGQIVGNSGSYGNAGANAYGAGAPLQIALHAKDGLVELYLNKNKIGSTTAGPSAFASPRTFAGSTYFGLLAQTFYRSLMEDLKVSGRSATSVIYSDYAYNTGGNTAVISAANPLGIASRSNPFA